MNIGRASVGRRCRIILGILAIFLAPLLVTGCGSSSKSVTKEETVYKAEGEQGEQGKVVKETTIIKEKESHGLVGRFFILIGDVVALPFRMVAMVFDTVI